MTRCDAFENLLPLHATGDTTVEEALQVEEHLHGCAACRDELRFYATLTATAREELAQAPPAPEAEPRPRMARSPRLQRRGAWVFPGRGYPQMAAAAALLVAGLAVGTALGRWSAVTAPPRPEAAASVAAALAEARSVPLSVFSPAARARLSKVARAETGSRP